MRFIGAITGGIVGGLIGALIWAAIAYKTGYEIGWIAWGVGVLVGIGARIGSRGEDGMAPGLCAAVIALVSIAGGKLVNVYWVGSDYFAQEAGTIEPTDEHVTSVIAMQLVDEYAAAGKPLRWPDGKNRENVEEPTDFPADLWADAQVRLTKLTPDQRAGYEEYARDRFKSMLAQAQTEATASVFVESFSLFDLLWAFLAVGSAFKIAAGMGGDDD